MTKPSAKHLGVVTVTYNSENVITDFLDSLSGNVGNVHFTLYVVDNDSRDRTLQTIEDFDANFDIRILRNSENRGVAAGNNQGTNAALADGVDWVLFLNNDTIIPEGALAGLVSVADAKNIKILSPAIKATEPADTIWFDGGIIRPVFGMKVVHERMGEKASEIIPGLRETPYASTCCLLVHPSVFERIGGMDTDYFVYFDDVDFSVRAQAAGFVYWLIGDLTITHKASSLTGGFLGAFTLRWLTRNWVLISRKHLTPMRRTVAFGYMQLWMMARLLVGRDKPAHYVRRQKAFLEGLFAPISNDGTILHNSEILPKNGPISQILRKESYSVAR